MPSCNAARNCWTLTEIDCDNISLREVIETMRFVVTTSFSAENTILLATAFSCSEGELSDVWQAMTVEQRARSRVMDDLTRTPYRMQGDADSVSDDNGIRNILGTIVDLGVQDSSLPKQLASSIMDARRLLDGIGGRAKVSLEAWDASETWASNFQNHAR
jgi:hypothetical protein